MCIPYTYRIKFIPDGREYYGVRYSKKASPDGFWKTYFTSSKVVKALIVEHGAEAFEIVEIKIHATKEDALAFEEAFLLSVDAGRSTQWLNRHSGGLNFCSTGEYFNNNPIARKEQSEKLKSFYENNPEARYAVSKTMRAFYENNPEALEEMRRRGKELYENNPSAREAMSKSCKGFYENNPAARKVVSQKSKEFWANNPEARVSGGKKTKEFYANNPEARAAASMRVRNRYASKIERIKLGVAIATGYARKVERPFSYWPRQEASDIT